MTKPRTSQLAQTGATTGQGLIWNGTYWLPATVVDAAAIPKSLVDAKGDLLVATANDTVARLAVGTNGQVLEADSAAASGVAWKTRLSVVIFPYSYTGTVATVSGTSRLYAERAMTITSVRASVGTAPTGASLIVDVNKNGTTIFTNQANRPTIAAGTNSDLANEIDVTALVQGDYLTVDVDQVGSTTAGSNLTVVIEVTT